MNDLISRQAAIDELKKGRALFCDNTPESFSRLSYGDKCRVDEVDNAIAVLVNLPSAQQETSFITWLLDEIWDDEMWELNWQAFPEIVCRKLAKFGYLMEKDGEYERLDK